MDHGKRRVHCASVFQIPSRQHAVWGHALDRCGVVELAFGKRPDRRFNVDPARWRGAGNGRSDHGSCRGGVQIHNRLVTLCLGARKPVLEHQSTENTEVGIHANSVFPGTACLPIRAGRLAASSAGRLLQCSAPANLVVVGGDRVAQRPRGRSCGLLVMLSCSVASQLNGFRLISILVAPCNR